MTIIISPLRGFGTAIISQEGAKAFFESDFSLCDFSALGAIRAGGIYFTLRRKDAKSS